MSSVPPGHAHDNNYDYLGGEIEPHLGENEQAADGHGEAEASGVGGDEDRVHDQHGGGREGQPRREQYQARAKVVHITAV